MQFSAPPNIFIVLYMQQNTPQDKSGFTRYLITATHQDYIKHVTQEHTFLQLVYAAYWWWLEWQYKNTDMTVIRTELLFRSPTFFLF